MKFYGTKLLPVGLESDIIHTMIGNNVNHMKMQAGYDKGKYEKKDAHNYWCLSLSAME